MNMKQMFTVHFLGKKASPRIRNARNESEKQFWEYRQP